MTNHKNHHHRHTLMFSGKSNNLKGTYRGFHIVVGQVSGSVGPLVGLSAGTLLLELEVF